MGHAGGVGGIAGALSEPLAVTAAAKAATSAPLPAAGEEPPAPAMPAGDAKTPAPGLLALAGAAALAAGVARRR